MSALTDALSADDGLLYPTGPLNAHEHLAHQHAQRSATRALAGLARDRDDFDLLAAMLGLEAAEARAVLPPLERTPVLAAPLVVREQTDTRPPGLRFVATERQQQERRTSRPVKAAPAPRVHLPTCDRGDSHAGRCTVPLDEARCREMYASGQDVVQVSRTLGVATSRVQTYLREQGLLRRAASQRTATPRLAATARPARPQPAAEQPPADGLCLVQGCTGTWKHRGRHARPLDDVEVARRYQAGEGLFELAKSLGVGANRVRGALAEAGVPLRGRGQVLHRTSPTPLDVDRCRTLYTEGLTTIEVGRQLGVRPTRVADQMRAEGLLRAAGQSGKPRRKRTITDEHREKLRQNIAKARAARWAKRGTEASA